MEENHYAVNHGVTYALTIFLTKWVLVLSFFSLIINEYFSVRFGFHSDGERCSGVKLLMFFFFPIFRPTSHFHYPTTVSNGNIVVSEKFRNIIFPLFTCFLGFSEFKRFFSKLLYLCICLNVQIAIELINFTKNRLVE